MINNHQLFFLGACFLSAEITVGDFSAETERACKSSQCHKWLLWLQGPLSTKTLMVCEKITNTPMSWWCHVCAWSLLWVTPERDCYFNASVLPHPSVQRRKFLFILVYKLRKTRSGWVTLDLTELPGRTYSAFQTIFSQSLTFLKMPKL